MLAGGRPAEVQFLGQGDEVAQLTQLEAAGRHPVRHGPDDRLFSPAGAGQAYGPVRHDETSSIAWADASIGTVPRNVIANISVVKA